MTCALGAVWNIPSCDCIVNGTGVDFGCLTFDGDFGKDEMIGSCAMCEHASGLRVSDVDKLFVSLLREVPFWMGLEAPAITCVRTWDRIVESVRVESFQF